jgi:hypothetical protein
MRRRKRLVVKNQDLQHIFDDVAVYGQLCDCYKATEKTVEDLMRKHGAWEDSDMLLSLIKRTPPGYFRFRMCEEYYRLCPEEKEKAILRQERIAAIPANEYKALGQAYGYLYQMATWYSLICHLSEIIIAALKDRGFYDDEYVLITIHDALCPYGSVLLATIDNHLNEIRIASFRSKHQSQNE